MTIRYETPRIEDIGSLTELTAGGCKHKFGAVTPAMGKTRHDGSSFSGSVSTGFSGATTNTNSC